jgi:ribokinase
VDFQLNVLNFGSLNIDYVYSLDHIVTPGETIHSTEFEMFSGGKGLNQSIALSRAGVSVYHAGMVGQDGNLLIDLCRENGINTKYIKTKPVQTGHAIIQIDKQGQNSIILFGGANRQNTKEFVDTVLSDFNEGDMILLQNEINLIDYIIDRAYEKRMIIAMNPSPLDENLLSCDLNKVSIFILNEVEGYQITHQNNSDDILFQLKKDFPEARIVLTLGDKGSVYQYKDKRCTHGVYAVNAVDTTAAGDTFTGYFLASIAGNESIEVALSLASKAAGIAVSKKGTANSIPYMDEVKNTNLSIYKSFGEFLNWR